MLLQLNKFLKNGKYRSVNEIFHVHKSDFYTIPYYIHYTIYKIDNRNIRVQAYFFRFRERKTMKDSFVQTDK